MSAGAGPISISIPKKLTLFTFSEARRTLSKNNRSPQAFQVQPQSSASAKVRLKNKLLSGPVIVLLQCGLAVSVLLETKRERPCIVFTFISTITSDPIGQQPNFRVYNQSLFMWQTNVELILKYLQKGKKGTKEHTDSEIYQKNLRLFRWLSNAKRERSSNLTAIRRFQGFCWMSS